MLVYSNTIAKWDLTDTLFPALAVSGVTSVKGVCRI